jgi:hypothetical protein
MMLIIRIPSVILYQSAAIGRGFGKLAPGTGHRYSYAEAGI